jgi:hypothetical protein
MTKHRYKYYGEMNSPDYHRLLLLERKRFFGRKKAASYEALSQLIDLGHLA